MFESFKHTAKQTFKNLLPNEAAPTDAASTAPPLEAKKKPQKPRLFSLANTDFPTLDKEKLVHLQQLAEQNEEAIRPLNFYTTRNQKFVEDTPQNRFVQPLRDVVDDFLLSMAQNSQPTNPDAFSALSTAYQHRIEAIQTACPPEQQAAFTHLLEAAYDAALQDICRSIFDAFLCAVAVYKMSGKIALSATAPDAALTDSAERLNHLANAFAQSAQTYGENARTYTRLQHSGSISGQSEAPFVFNDFISENAPLSFPAFSALLSLTKMLSYTIEDINAYVRTAADAIHYLPFASLQPALASMVLTKLAFAPTGYPSALDWLANHLSEHLEEPPHIYLPPAPEPAAPEDSTLAPEQAPPDTSGSDIDAPENALAHENATPPQALPEVSALRIDDSANTPEMPPEMPQSPPAVPTATPSAAAAAYTAGSNGRAKTISLSDLAHNHPSHAQPRQSANAQSPAIDFAVDDSFDVQNPPTPPKPEPPSPKGRNFDWTIDD